MRMAQRESKLDADSDEVNQTVQGKAVPNAG
jgi:hypothetical protein